MYVGACALSCGTCEQSQVLGSQQHFSAELENHKKWLTDIFWLDAVPEDAPGLLAAIMLMAEQLTSNAVQQTQMIGSIFDAKHQLESQRLFQTLTARAHKDYHPNEKLCEVGTIARPLAASERKSNITAQYISKSSIDRQLLAHDDQEGPLVESSTVKDKYTRLKDYILHFCNKNDNGGNLHDLCKSSVSLKKNKNRDIDYTGLVDSQLTIDMDLLDGVASIGDETAIFHLMNNLISEEVMPNVPAEKLIATQGANSLNPEGGSSPAYGNASIKYLNSRALAAKRSVAINSLSAIASLKAKGSPESDPFIYAIIKELNPELITDEQIIEYIGENPSYYAQMEVLTKKLYQHPNFYAELYDKPANVKRKDVAIQAAELMQKRDIYRSLLRSEAILATMLETALIPQYEDIKNILTGGVEKGFTVAPGGGG